MDVDDSLRELLSYSEHQHADDDMNCASAGLPAALNQNNSPGAIFNLTITVTSNLLCLR